MILKKYFLSLVILSIINLHAFSQEGKKILFVGNSYTYVGNMPHQVGAMAKFNNIDITIKKSVVGGATLGEHWRDDRGLKTMELIKQGDFDAIVLQDQSLRAIQYSDSLQLYGEKIASVASEKNIKVYLYMTWAREYDPLMQREIETEYNKLAKKVGAEVVPVGLAWEKARSLRPTIPIFADDGSHPTPLGSYLTACVFYAVFTGKSPIGLPNELPIIDQYGETLYVNLQSGGNSTFCQKVADMIVFGN